MRKNKRHSPLLNRSYRPIGMRLFKSSSHCWLHSNPGSVLSDSQMGCMFMHRRAQGKRPLLPLVERDLPEPYACGSPARDPSEGVEWGRSELPGLGCLPVVTG